MNRDKIRSELLAALAGIVPEADLEAVDPGVDLRDQIDLDSMDIFNLIVALHQRLGVNVPEVDAPKLTTINGAVDYLAARLDGAGPS